MLLEKLAFEKSAGPISFLKGLPKRYRSFMRTEANAAREGVGAKPLNRNLKPSRSSTPVTTEQVKETVRKKKRKPSEPKSWWAKRPLWQKAGLIGVPTLGAGAIGANALLKKRDEMQPPYAVQE